EVGSFVLTLELNAVEGAGARGRRGAAALRTAVCLAARSLLHEQQLDSPVRSRRQGLVPAGHGSSVPPRLCPPALDRVAHLPGSRMVEVGPRRLEELRRRGVRL